jgi:hypothetical protein
LVIECATDVRLERVVIRGAQARSRIAGSHDLTLIDCVIGIDPEASGQQCLLIAQPAGTPPRPVDASCSNIRIVGGEFRAATQHAIHVGAGQFSVTGFEISHARIFGAFDNGILIWNSSRGAVIGNQIIGARAWGIQEIGAGSNDNLILGNWLYANAGTLSFVGSRTQVVRNWAEANAPLPDSGGFRQTIDGWAKLSIAATQSSIPMDRNVGRFRAVRPGSITGLVVTTSLPRTGTSGTLKVTAYLNPGNSGVTGLSTGFFVEINANTNRASKTQPIDVATSQFLPGDELYLMVETSGFSVGTGDPPFNVYAALEIED